MGNINCSSSDSSKGIEPTHQPYDEAISFAKYNQGERRDSTKNIVSDVGIEGKLPRKAAEDILRRRCSKESELLDSSAVSDSLIKENQDSSTSLGDKAKPNVSTTGDMTENLLLNSLLTQLVKINENSNSSNSSHGETDGGNINITKSSISNGVSFNNSTSNNGGDKCDGRQVPCNEKDLVSSFSGANIMNILSASKSKIFRIVLTGGPCAGKSSVLNILKAKLPEKFGIKVYSVPEAATLLVCGGLEWSEDPTTTTQYQLALLRTQIALETQFYNIALASGQPSVIICDRGALDGRAYCTEEQFSEILRLGNWTIEKLRDDRYDAVIHMVTAANGAPHYYNFDNPARWETLEQAVVNDLKLSHMYVGHPLVRVFGNNVTSFQSKLDAVFNFVTFVIGRTFPVNSTQRLLLRGILLIGSDGKVNKSELKKLENITLFTQHIRVTKTFLSNNCPTEVKELEKREVGNRTFCFFITYRFSENFSMIYRKFYNVGENIDKEGVKDVNSSNLTKSTNFSPNNGAKVNLKSPKVNNSSNNINADHANQPCRKKLDINSYFDLTRKSLEAEHLKSTYRIEVAEYGALLKLKDPSRVEVTADLFSFMYDYQYCNLYVVNQPVWAAGAAVMYVDNYDPAKGFPPGITIERDITNDPLTMNFNLISRIVDGANYVRVKV